MGLAIITVLFLVLVFGWTLLPFVPAIREVRHPGDTAPLPVSPESRVKIGHFAATFSEQADRQFGKLIAECRRDNKTLSGKLEDGPHYLIVPGDDSPITLPAEEQDFCERIIISAGSLRLPARFVHAAEIKATGDVTGGEAAVYRAILAGGSLALAPDSTSLRWLHAAGDLVAGETCLLRGRISALRSIRLAPGCRFERLQAPLVDFGTPEDVGAQPGPPEALAETVTAIDPGQVPHLCNTDGGRWLVNHKFELAAGDFLDSDLVVRGDIVLRAGSHARGNIKSRGTLTVEPGARVEGSLVAERDLTLGEDSFVSGPVICEATLTLQRGSRVGTPEQPSTVTAANIKVEPGARCHGTVWAHERGDVLVPEALATSSLATEGAPA